jgi:2-polyprenyl-3-methyl-5-hydroxy-6-metoxy-1,4-benzoquinol methylase
MISPFQSLSPKALEEVTCNLCGCDNYRILYRIQSFNIVRCNNCGLVYTNPRLSQEDLRRLYTRQYFESSYPATFGYAHYLQMRNQVKKAYKPRLEVIEKYVRGRRLLDIGCAAGFFLELASERGWQAEGVDVSEYATEYGKNLGLKIFTGTLIEASFPDQYFDAVTMWDCLMHMPDPYGTMVEINRILKRGGILAFDALNIDSLNCKLFGERWSALQKLEHIYYFSVQTINKLLKKSGFKILEIQLCSSPLSLSDILPQVPNLAKKVLRLFSLLLTLIGINSKDEIIVYSRKV